jgi:antitoxin PrlF
MLSSKLSSKGQITVPKEVRKKIGVKPGDTIVYEVKGNLVKLRRAEPFDVEFHSALTATLDEWATPEDEKAFRGL